MGSRLGAASVRRNRSLRAASLPREVELHRSVPSPYFQPGQAHFRESKLMGRNPRRNSLYPVFMVNGTVTCA